MRLRPAVAGKACALVCVMSVAACGGGGGSSGAQPATTGLTDTALASNGVIAAAHTDVNLQNAWGIAAAPNGVFWIADNSTNDFVITTATGSQPAQYLFAGEGGTINGWAQTVSGTNAPVAYDDGAGGAVYKGLALLNDGTANHLYATDLHNAKIDVFDAGFNKVTRAGTFADSTIPAGFAPFNIVALGNQLYVSYAKQDATAHDEVLGAGLGYVNIFDANGTFVKRFASTGSLNAPWGIAMAPAGFGAAAGDLLIGNFGDGAINYFDPATGQRLGAISLASGKQLIIPGLWALAFGNGATNQPATDLFYTAGPTNQTDGVFGSIKVVTSSSPPPCTGYGC